MFFRKIKLQNIKSYYGEHVIDFPTPVESRPIHLIGAPNGSGKTTLFQAITAGLFASQSDPMLRANYLSRGSDAQEMSVEIEFEVEPKVYVLKRSWQRNRARPETSARSVTLRSSFQSDSGGPITDDEQITNLMDFLMPYSISDFFLFDGEQIQEYTDASEESIKGALERLLGLHSYIQLRDDIENLEPDLRKDRNALDVGDDLSAGIKRRDAVQSHLRDIARQRPRVQRASSESEKDLRDLEESQDWIMSSLDPQLQAQRHELSQTRDRLADDIENLETRMKALVPDALALSPFWPQLQEAADQAISYKGSLDLEELIGFLWEHRDGIADALSEDTPEPLRSVVMSLVGTDQDAVFSQSVAQDAAELLARIRLANQDLWAVPDKLDALKSERERVAHELDNVLPVPSSSREDVEDLRRRLNEAHTLVSRHKTHLSKLADEERRLKREEETLNNEISELNVHDSKFRQLNAQMDLCERLQNVLETFISDYRQTRFDDLRRVFNRKFRELTNAPDLVERVEINSETYEITIRPRAGTNLTAQEQSAGQKEVLALTLISSVVELSNRQFPVVIDTPLARLDSAHRDNILTKFFPHVGKQVIILSTDTEIGFEQRRRLSPFLASEHRLVRDPQTARTSIEDGYVVK